jgi:hypothetical protein
VERLFKFKSKYRNKLEVDDDIRLYLTKLEPNIDQLYQQKPFSLIFLKVSYFCF